MQFLEYNTTEANLGNTDIFSTLRCWKNVFLTLFWAPAFAANLMNHSLGYFLFRNVHILSWVFQFHHYEDLAQYKWIRHKRQKMYYLSKSLYNEYTAFFIKKKTPILSLLFQDLKKNFLFSFCVSEFFEASFELIL